MYYDPYVYGESLGSNDLRKDEVNDIHRSRWYLTILSNLLVILKKFFGLTLPYIYSFCATIYKCEGQFHMKLSDAP